MFNKTKNILFTFLVIFFITGCGQPTPQELRKIALENKIEKDYKKWIANGYTKQDANNWRKNSNLYYDKAILWIKAGITNPFIAYKWIHLSKSPQEAKKWIDLGVDMKIAQKYNVDDFILKAKNAKLSTKEYVAWINFGETEVKVINFWKSKGYDSKNIINKTAKSILNSMDTYEFFKFMGISDYRLINTYIYHWKYTTNYTRFYKVLDDPYDVLKM